MVELIAGSVLAHFSPLVSDLGGDPDRLLQARGIDPAAAGDVHRMISYTAAAAAIAAAADSLARPDFGLLLAQRQGIDILGPVAVLIRNAQTVSGAIEGVCRYLHRCSPLDIAGLELGARTAVFNYDLALRQVAHREQIIEKSLGVALQAFRLMIGDDFKPVRVTMRHRRLSSEARYREFFDCPVEFNCAINGIHFSADMLERPIRGRDAAALELAEKFLAQNGPDLPLAEHVRETIHRLMRVSHAALVPVADAMALHPRVLQRRLAEIGTSFEEILEEVRRDMSLQLSQSGLKVSQIAAMLGYAEQSSYSRACQRWYGKSPRQLIAGHREMASVPSRAGHPG